MGPRSSYPSQDCSLARALEVVGERWTLLVIRDLFYGLQRFGDLQVHLGIPTAVLTDRLHTLVALQIVQRRGRATGTTYALTERGLELWPAVYALAQWGEQQFASDGARRVISHVNCGTDLTRTGWCVICDCAPPPADLVIRSGPGADPIVRADRVSVALRKRPHRLLTALFPEHAPTPDGTCCHDDPEGAV